MPPNGSTVTVGSFDGVHLGHRAVLDAVARRARASGRVSVLVTFDPHPLAVVRPDRAPPLLTTHVERLEALVQMPVDYVLVLRFDRALASYSPERFVREILVARCGMRELVIGHDHGFGRARSGSVETLRQLGETDGFVVDVVDAVGAAEQEVSSTEIRRAIAAGDLAGAAVLLGRPYTLSGPVVRGDGRGRALGVRTINVELPTGKLLPPDGVYAVRVEWPGGVAGGMMNQGGRPTFGDDRRLLEAHLFDLDVDLYGAQVRLEWVQWLRGTQTFASADALVAQLAQDRRDAEAALLVRAREERAATPAT
jgi:riboflavin kinase/FMN adenylyltransferase